MRTQSHKEIVEEYSASRGSYEGCLDYVENTVESIIKSQSINVHEIIGRVKTVESLEGKVKRKNYSNLVEITDLCGIRIITYFSDDVDKIAELISQEFEVDVENTIDKRKSEDPTKFGYVSLHYVVGLKEGTTPSTLYGRFKNIKLEIQIRTVMQHAWAEIEHDLGYKSKEDIPDQYRRQFSRLAGLIELADDNFLQLKNNINNYEQEVRKKLPTSKEELPIDSSTLMTYVTEDPNYIKLLDEIKLLDVPINFNINSSYLSTVVQRAKSLGLKTIGDIDKLLEKYKDIFLRVYEIEMDIVHYTGISVLTPLLHITNVLESVNNINISDEKFMKVSDAEFSDEFGISYPNKVYEG
ncbi:relA/spoT family protein [Streptococcus mitis 21/39]|jgi:region found in relA / spoT proteins family protein|uniref:RelA/spoT family protein n=1 Tax=Streptococcus mitis 21/39 TaxID=1415765 RepID=V8HY30_STRMT|nr:RelA/SpoT family protein [Streptococcus mitis]ETD93645.1 relA/spoT family protein [Streptococcus mitis 21/39]